MIDYNKMKGDYKNGKIYSIRSHLTDEFYIGSTISTLTKRFFQHKNDNKKFIAGTLKWCCSSFQILNFGDAYIELLEEYPCENKNQLDKREGEFIRKNECVNKNIAGRTQVEYYQDNKQKIIEKQQEYREQNKEQLAEKKKEYYEQNKEQLAEKKKEYYQKNKEQSKEYYQKNKDKINEKFVCECGGCYSYTHKLYHLKTKKHLKYIATF